MANDKSVTQMHLTQYISRIVIKTRRNDIAILQTAIKLYQETMKERKEKMEKNPMHTKKGCVEAIITGYAISMCNFLLNSE